MNPNIHTYTSKELMLQVNAYIVEAEDEIVIIDTTLTMSDSKALKQKADSLEKPLAGIFLTHGHPDHVAGTYNLAPDGEIPIYALSSVNELMEATELEKHAQWSDIFGDEWIPEWIYPNTLVEDGETVDIAGLKFKVHDIGSGGDCDANSLWLLDGEEPSAFIGDFIYNGNHTYMADGNILRWIANLEKYSNVLKNHDTFYIGHGAPCDFLAIAKQKEYITDYCAEILNATDGTAAFTEKTRKQFEETMFSKYPGYGCQFMVSLAADKVASELDSI